MLAGIPSQYCSHKGIVNIGTHMSIIKLSSGKFLVVDTIPLDPELKGVYSIACLTAQLRSMHSPTTAVIWML